MNADLPIIVAGHICLDVIPTFPDHAAGGNSRIEPGKLYDMGPALFSTGGAVSNTGLALHRLGVPATLMGKVADDLFGGEVLNLLRQHDSALADGMIVAESGVTSYSVVISPPGVDRSFLHCTGTNDTLTADDFELSQLQPGQLFHFGYPPLMQRFYADGGGNMQTLFSRLREQQLITSLDMAMPDPSSPAGQINWCDWLERVLPTVDLFLPSIEEILYMLGYDAAQAHDPQPELLRQIATELLEYGASIVAIKLGEHGLFLKSAGDLGCLPDRVPQPADSFRAAWTDRELWAPCFVVDVAGTTGAGDCTIAGLLAAFAQNSPPELTLSTAVAVGGCSVEAADATSGIPPLATIQQRITQGWRQHDLKLDSIGWTWLADAGVWSANR